MLQHTDFSVVVKNKARLPRPWRWEIYRAGRRTPIGHSDVYFETASEARQAGEKALKLLLSGVPNVAVLGYSVTDKIYIVRHQITCDRLCGD
ncbi:hypothetical protein DFP91_5815 [Pseudorhodoplanes sinuspersici]|nr:hypothetical protein DFP91_5815 [Pseudorhodoplanes sinuspersici]